jgi:hypothetical protein
MPHGLGPRSRRMGPWLLKRVGSLWVVGSEMEGSDLIATKGHMPFNRDRE